MKYNELKIHASNCQIAADEIAVKLINQVEIFSNISIFQSLCNFNLFWLYSISPEVALHIKSIKFLVENKNFFKRNITIKELLFYDAIIVYNKIDSFDDFKSIITVL